MAIYIGMGSDIHRLEKGAGFTLGGVHIDCAYRCVAVSDGDVLLHALTDAILGAGGLGDIGDHYPATVVSPGAASRKFVDESLSKITALGLRLVNVDCTINLETPRLSPWKERIRKSLAQLTLLPPARINVKAKTGEGIGCIGTGLAISATVVVLAETTGP